MSITNPLTHQTYKILNPGFGDSSVVYEVTDGAHTFAAKIFKRSTDFMRELQVLKRVSQLDHCARYISWFVDGEKGVILFEKLERNLLNKGPLNFLRVISAAIQLIESTVKLHATGLKNADLKPQKLNLDEETNVLNAFGLKYVEKDQKFSLNLKQTSYYLSPEVLIGEGHDPTVDAYSIGCIIFEFFTGLKLAPRSVGPYDFENMKEILSFLFYQIGRTPPTNFNGNPIFKLLFKNGYLLIPRALSIPRWTTIMRKKGADALIDEGKVEKLIEIIRGLIEFADRRTPLPEALETLQQFNADLEIHIEIDPELFKTAEKVTLTIRQIYGGRNDLHAAQVFHSVFTPETKLLSHYHIPLFSTKKSSFSISINGAPPYQKMLENHTTLTISPPIKASS